MGVVEPVRGEVCTHADLQLHSGVRQQRDSGSKTLILPFAQQAALRHRLERRTAALAPVREAFRLAEGPAASACMRGVLDEAQFEAFCALVNPAVTPREVAMLLAVMAPGGALQVRVGTWARLSVPSIKDYST